MSDKLKQLEARVEQLIDLCRKMRSENESLRSGRDALLKEHSKLTERHRLARDRLEGIIERLKNLEEA